MGKSTNIGWCHSTWSPWWGCIKVSPGCEHCYADTLSKRIGLSIWGPAKTTNRRLMSDAHWAQPAKWNKEARSAGERWRVFPSMCDPFEDHWQVRTERQRLFTLIRATPNLDWLLLTKRPENILSMIPDDWRKVAPINVWYGTSVESPDYSVRVDELRRVPAMVRFISYEPALEYVGFDTEGIHWVIVGGESGGGARPFNVNWARRTIIRGLFDGFAVYVKQLGTNPLDSAGNRIKLKAYKGDLMDEWPLDLQVRQFPG